MAFTYNPSGSPDNITVTRFHLYDKDRTEPIWTDAEISMVLALQDSEPIKAAIMLLEAEMVDRARSAAIIRLGSFGDNEQTVYQSLADCINRLREQLIVEPVVTDNKAEFVIPSSDLTTRLGTMDIW